MENNILIAEFVGLKTTNKCVRSETGKYYDYHANPKFSCIKEQEIQIEGENGFGLVEQDFLFIDDLKFHSDWNWLMEVVDKIEGLCSNLGFQIHSNFVHIRVNNNVSISSKVQTNRIEGVYSACVEFIKWYNQQPK